MLFLLVLNFRGIIQQFNCTNTYYEIIGIVFNKIIKFLEYLIILKSISQCPGKFPLSLLCLTLTPFSAIPIRIESRVTETFFFLATVPIFVEYDTFIVLTYFSSRFRWTYLIYWLFWLEIFHYTQKMKFSVKDFFSKRDQSANLVIFTEEIPNEKLHFLCSVFCDIDFLF